MSVSSTGWPDSFASAACDVCTARPPFEAASVTALAGSDDD